MSRFVFGLICGLVFGIVDVLIMIPLRYENNRKRVEAMSAAFIERFMIGLLIPNINLAGYAPIIGLFIGLFLSLPAAIITRVYIPIIATGVVGGAIIGVITAVLY
jgi:hypothetical protein